MKLTIELSEKAREVFQKLADKSGEALKDYIAAVLESSASEIKKYHISDDMDQALLDREGK